MATSESFDGLQVVRQPPVVVVEEGDQITTRQCRGSVSGR